MRNTLARTVAVPLASTVAALFASATGAMATTTNITFNGFCDGMQLQTSDQVNFTSIETGACLQGVSVPGIGKAVGSQLRMNVNWRAFTRKPDKKLYVLHFPLKNNAALKEYNYDFQNRKWVLLNTGRYTVQP